MLCDIFKALFYANLYIHLLTFTSSVIWTKLKSVLFIHPNCNHGRPDVVGEDADVLLQVTVTLVEFSNPVTHTLAFLPLFFPSALAFSWPSCWQKLWNRGLEKTRNDCINGQLFSDIKESGKKEIWIGERKKGGGCANARPGKKWEIVLWGGYKWEKRTEMERRRTQPKCPA